MRKGYSQDAAYSSLPSQPRTPKSCIYLFVYHLSTTGAHVAPTGVMGCIQPQSVLDLTLGSKDRWESVPLALAESPHICLTSSSMKGTQKTRIRKV